MISPWNFPVDLQRSRLVGQDLQSYTLRSESGRMKVSARRPLNTGDATDLTLTLDKTYYVLLVVAGLDFYVEFSKLDRRG